MTAAATPIQARPLPEKIGRYRILCELGHGAMAVIYLGRALGPRNFERLFAIKTIHDHLCRETSFVDMFLDEARLAARIHHPNVIPVYEVDVDTGRYFIAMEYVSGESLAMTLKHTWTKGRPFPIDIAVHIIAEACEGLHSAHELKDGEGRPLLVVHRDVAPQNVMLGYDGAIRMMDFGIAKAMDRVSGTRPGTLKGTVAYMSPEQIRTERLDRRADVFGLGVVLWETTVGKRLFKSENDINTAARVLRMNIPRPSTLRPNYPAKLDDIIMRALSRDRTKRQASARQLGEELRDLLVNEKMRVAAPDVEKFMKDVFGPLYEERAEMERKATQAVVPDRISPPVRVENSKSLSEIDSSIASLIDSLVSEETFVFDETDRAKKGEKTEVTETTQQVLGAVIPDTPTEQMIPTNVVRDRMQAHGSLLETGSTPVLLESELVLAPKHLKPPTPAPAPAPVAVRVASFAKPEDELREKTMVLAPNQRDLTLRVNAKDMLDSLNAEDEFFKSDTGTQVPPPSRMKWIVLGAGGSLVAAVALTWALTSPSSQASEQTKLDPNPVLPVEVKRAPQEELKKIEPVFVAEEVKPAQEIKNEPEPEPELEPEPEIVEQKPVVQPEPKNIEPKKERAPRITRPRAQQKRVEKTVKAERTEKKPPPVVEDTKKKKKLIGGDDL